MKKLVIVTSLASAVLVATAAESDCVYAYDAATQTYVATVVEADATADISEAAATLLNANAFAAGQPITNFVKRGLGRLVVPDTRDLKDYTGAVTIEQGFYRSYLTKTGSGAANYTVGSHTGDALHVVDGATWELAPTAGVQNVFLQKPVYFAGAGVDGKGALHIFREGSALNNTQDNKPLGHPMIMTSNAWIRSTLMVPVTLNCELSMNGHDLSMEGAKWGSGTTGYAVSLIAVFTESSRTVSALGNITITNGVQTSGFKWAQGVGGSLTFTVTDNTVYIVGGSYGNNAYEVILRPGTIVQCNGNLGVMDPDLGIVWDTWANRFSGGRVVLQDPVRNVFRSAWGHFINLCEPVSGGGLQVEKDLRLILGSDANTFTNGVVVSDTARLVITKANAVPSAGAPVVLKDNAYLQFKDSTKAYELPEVICQGVTNHLRGAMDYIWPETEETGAQKYAMLTFTNNVTVEASTNVIVETFKGFGTLLGGNGFRIGTSWTVDIAEAVTGGRLKTAGALQFADTAAIIVSGTAKPPAGTRSYVIAEAEGGVTGLGTRSSKSADGLWCAAAGTDGKTVVATYLPPGTLVIVQ